MHWDTTSFDTTYQPYLDTFATVSVKHVIVGYAIIGIIIISTRLEFCPLSCCYPNLHRIPLARAHGGLSVGILGASGFRVVGNGFRVGFECCRYIKCLHARMSLH